jgi:hypothetical protein
MTFEEVKRRGWVERRARPVELPAPLFVERLLARKSAGEKALDWKRINE